MSRAVLLKVAAGVAAYLIFLFATLPAPLAYGWLQGSLANLPGKPALQGISGTLWEGKAQTLSYEQKAIGSFSWQLSPWGLTIGSLGMEAQLQTPGGYLDAELTAGFDYDADIEALEGRLPVMEVLPYFVRLPVVMDGMVSVNAQELLLREGRPYSVEGGKLVWHQAAVVAPIAMELGDLVAEVVQVGEGITLELKDMGGPLKLDGRLGISPDGEWQLTLALGTNPGAPAELRQMLNTLGSPDGQGMVARTLSGTL